VVIAVRGFGASHDMPLSRKRRTRCSLCPTWEAFEQLVQEAGYFATGLRKTEAGRWPAEPPLDLWRQRSSRGWGLTPSVLFTTLRVRRTSAALGGSTHGYENNDEVEDV
jgi:hypothetical protein